MDGLFWRSRLEGIAGLRGDIGVKEKETWVESSGMNNGTSKAMGNGVGNATAADATGTMEGKWGGDRSGKYLTFVLGTEEFGIAILKAREIIGFQEVTAVPRTPGYVRGVFNLRGQVITVVDLRAKFGMERVERTEHTCIIVTEIAAEGRAVSVGVVVDKVSEVLSIAGENIEDAPAFGTGVETGFILGMGKVGKSVKILLDIDRVLGAEKLAELGEVSAAA